MAVGACLRPSHHLHPQRCSRLLLAKLEAGQQRAACPDSAAITCRRDGDRPGAGAAAGPALRRPRPTKLISAVAATASATATLIFVILLAAAAVIGVAVGGAARRPARGIAASPASS